MVGINVVVAAIVKLEMDEPATDFTLTPFIHDPISVIRCALDLISISNYSSEYY